MAKATVDPVRFRQSLLGLLESEPPREEKLLAELEARRQEGCPLYSSILYLLTHLSFSEHEAKRHWQRVSAHRESLKAMLGRDVGLRVAVLDYFVNVNRELRNPKVIEIAIYEKTERSAITDGLTGLYNHAYFLQVLRREVQRSKRHRLQLSLVLLDLDDFKRVNDTRGHLEGDRVLVKTAGLVRESLREIDVAARYGGEEFAVVLPDTPRTGAYVVADRIRRRVDAYHRRRRDAGQVTISGGVATYPEDATTAEGLIQRADEGLYRSKAAGKNRITLVQGERRRNPRVPSSHRLALTGGDGLRTVARVKNVSEGGLLIRLRRALQVGATIDLETAVHTAPALRGQVVRVERVAGPSPSYDVGVRLLADPTQTARAFRRLSAPAAHV
jgi:diguanylate cyclase (GGDEF)-like protein